MKIGIIGGGAVGLLFGAYYSDEHYVTIFTKRKEHANKINHHGIHLLNKYYNTIHKVNSIAIDKQLNDQEFLIIAVKQYDLANLISTIRKVPKQTPLFFIQNGIGHVELLESLPQQTIFVGTVEHGVKKLNDFSIQHTGVGKTNVSLYRGELLEKEKFPLSGKEMFPFQFQENYEEMLASKLIANAIINPLTALLGVKNGKLIENPFFYTLFLKLYGEVAAVFPNYVQDDTLLRVEAICKNTKENTSSMLKDLQVGRKTEIEAILGSILKKGEGTGCAMPFANAIYKLIKGLELERGLRN